MIYISYEAVITGKNAVSVVAHRNSPDSLEAPLYPAVLFFTTPLMGKFGRCKALGFLCDKNGT